MIQYLLICITAYTAYKIYTWTRCPKEIEHLPALPMFSFFIFMLSKESFPEKMKKEFQPMFDQYGMIRAYTHLGWAVLIGCPKLCKEASAKNGNFIIGLGNIFIKQDFSNVPVSDLVMKFFGRSIVLTSNYDEWKRHRKVINPIFNQSWDTKLFGDCVEDVIDKWEKQAGGEIKVHDTMQRMTLDVFGKYIFDVNFNAVKDINPRVYHLYNYITDKVLGEFLYVLAPFMEHVPFFSRPKLADSLNEYHEFIEEMVDAKKKKLHEGNIKSKDLITCFIESNEKEVGFRLTNDEIRDNINVFIVAGHDTTSNTLSSTLYYLARYPEIQDRLRKEILEALDHPSELTTPTIEQLKHIPYMDLVNKESMRIMTTAAMLQRDTAKTHTLSNGVTIPKGTAVFFHLWGVHHGPEFLNPEEFNPDRFSDLHNEESRNWQPFLTGPRSCPGITFSLMEQRVTIAMLLQKFEFSILPTNPDYEKLRISPNGIVRPSDLSLIVKLRT